MSLLSLPVDCLAVISDWIGDHRTFFSFALVCKKTAAAIRRKEVQARAKNRFTRQHEEEGVTWYELPNWWKHGKERHYGMLSRTSECTWVNNERHGLQQWWWGHEYEEGKKYYPEYGPLRSSVMWIHGKKEGLEEDRAGDGRVMAYWNWKNGKLHGETMDTDFRPVGRDDHDEMIEIVSHYYEGKLHGERCSYYIDDNYKRVAMRTRSHWRHGKKHGLKEGWFADGTPTHRKWYRGGRLKKAMVYYEDLKGFGHRKDGWTVL